MQGFQKDSSCILFGKSFSSPTFEWTKILVLAGTPTFLTAMKNNECSNAILEWPTVCAPLVTTHMISITTSTQLLTDKTSQLLKG